MSLRFLVVGLAVVLAVLHRSALAEMLPVEAFSARPKVEALKLSPAGNRLAYVANVGDKTALVTVDLISGESTVVATIDNRKFSFLWQRWVGDAHLLISATYPHHRYGVRSTETRLLRRSRVTAAPCRTISPMPRAG